MKYLALIPTVWMCACSAMPQIADDIEKIATDDVITVKIDRDAFSKDTDVFVDVRVINKDIPSSNEQKKVAD